MQDVVEMGGTRDEAVLARIAAHVLRGLSLLHAHRQLHRDIKVGEIEYMHEGISWCTP